MIHSEICTSHAESAEAVMAVTEILVTFLH